MRKIYNVNVILVLVFMLIVSSCSKENDPTNNSIKDQVEDNILNDTWKITYYFDSDKDETSHFTGYSFVFQDNNSLIASTSSASFTGIWSLTDSKSSDDSLDDLDFNISFNVGNQLDELSDDWDFVTQSSSKIELIDVSGGNGGIDYLTFTKN